MKKYWPLILLLLAAVLALAREASAADVNINAVPYLAKPDDGLDDSAGIQRAIDAAYGKRLVGKSGVYMVAKTLRWEADKDWVVDLDPGAILDFKPVLGPEGYNYTRCVEVIGKGNSDTRKFIRNLMLRGPQRGVFPKDLGKLVGFYAKWAHGLEVQSLRIQGFDHSGLNVYHCYRANFQNVDVKFNGWGIYCDGANGTSFGVVSAMYNINGTLNIQSLRGGSIEGNARSGSVFSEIGMRYSVEDVWYEQNVLVDREPTDGEEGDIKILAPCVVHLGGSTTFHTPKTKERNKHDAYYITAEARCHIETTGASRYFSSDRPMFNLLRNSTVMDLAAGNAMLDDDLLPFQKFTGPVHYFRPSFTEHVPTTQPTN